MKLSKAQQDVIDKLKSGWQLGRLTGFDCGWWLQKGELGRGAQICDVKNNTVHALIKRGLIEQKRYGSITPFWGLTKEKKP